MGWEKKIRNVKKKFISVTTASLPQSLQSLIYRNITKVPFAMPEDTVIKVAETTQELYQAFKLLHKVYCEAGFIDSNNAGIFLKKYHALNTSAVIIAKSKSKVIATVSLIKDGEMGLPVDEVFNIGSLRKKGEIAEVSSFAIDENYRRVNKGSMLFFMMKYIWEYAHKIQKIDYLVISIYPRHLAFYSSILLFKSISSRVSSYMGKPACCAYLNLNKSPMRYKNQFAHRPQKNNFYNFFIKSKSKNFELPKKSSEIMDYKRFKYFFQQKTSVYFTLSKRDCKVLAKQFKINMTNNPYNETLIKRLNANILEQRFKSPFNGLIKYKNSRLSLCTGINVSKSGICIKHSQDLNIEPGEKLDLNIHLKNFGLITLKVSTKWSKGGKSGCHIMQKSMKWENYINELSD